MSSSKIKKKMSLIRQRSRTKSAGTHEKTSARLSTEAKIGKFFAQDWIGEPAPSVINTGDFNNKICFSKRMDVNNHGRNRWSDDLWWVINHPSLPFEQNYFSFFFLFLESFLL